MTVVMSIAVVLLIILIISMAYEPRNFWNAILLLLTVGFFALAFAMKPGYGGLIFGLIVALIPLAFLFVAVFLIRNGFVMMKKEGKSPANLLSLFTGVAMIAASVFTPMKMYELQDDTLLRAVFYLVLLLELYIAFTFVALLCYSVLYTHLPKRIKCDYIIVHGCGLINGERVSPLLKGRVDKAVEIYKTSKGHPKIVVSGGQGGDEKISEAEAMKNYLLEIGQPECDIIMEDKSATTYENLKNVRDMLDRGGIRHSYIFVTNNYHVFRTSLFARKLRMKAVGVGCRTASYYWPSAFIREYIAIMVMYKWIFAVIAVLWAILVAIIRM